MSAASLPLLAGRNSEPAERARERLQAARPAPSKWAASILSLALLAAVVVPIGQNWMPAPQDDFPLSYYPMFSFEKADRQRVTYLIVYDARGTRLLLPYWYAGQGGLNQVRRQMNTMLGRGQAARICRNVAARVARSDDLPAGLQSVQVVTGVFLMSEFFAGNRIPVSETVRAHCAVSRG